MRPVQDSAPVPPAEKRPRIRRRLRTPLEAQQWRRKMTAYALYGAAFVLIVNALVGESGYLATLSGKGEQERATRELALMRHKNQALQEQIERLKHDPAAVEEEARRKLNMIKKGEVMVVVKDKDGKK
jgi:cell division protein FtsB